MKLEIQVKNIYGKETIYPVNELAMKFADLLNQSTLTRNDLKKIMGMGFEVVIKSQELCL